MQTSIKPVVLLVLIAAQVMAQGPSAFVVAPNGDRIQGSDISADPDGNIKLKIGAATRTFKKDTYRDAYIPKPRAVEMLEQAFIEERYDVVKKQAADQFEAYKYLGWAGKIAYLEASAYLAEGKSKEALQIIANAERYARPDNEDLLKGKINALIAADQDQPARLLLVKLKAAASRETAAFAFNTSGTLLLKEGKKEDAVLEFLKTMLLFEPGKVPVQRQEAKRQVVAILKEMGDRRWQDFEKME